MKAIKPRAVKKKNRILRVVPAITGPAGLETSQQTQVWS